MPGRVTSRHFEEFYRERTTAASIVLQLGRRPGGVAATQIATDHIELTTYAGDSTVAPGYRTAVVLNVTPRPGMHVYAQGASGYRPIRLTIAPDPLLRILPIHFPPSEIYFFAPLKERVPVYQKPWVIVSDPLAAAK